MRDWITKDFWWKLFSVFLAVAIWLTVHKTAVPTSVVAGVPLTYGSVPVLVVSSASDVRDFRVLPGTVAVKVSGAAEVMAVLQANQIHAVVNLTDITAARNLKRRVEVSTPPGVTLVSVDPPEVGVLFPPQSDNKP
ncbi:MAG: CdaR family protein [Verrucomicrobiales bacterium]|nr:CdaR family protein [Verrucomicrobiales bacterium]